MNRYVVFITMPTNEFVYPEHRQFFVRAQNKQHALTIIKNDFSGIGINFIVFHAPK